LTQKRPARKRGGLLVQGDCLDELPGLVLRSSDRFDMVYVDPPFNAGGQRAARLTRGSRANGVLAYRDAWGGIEAFARMLEPRLAAIREVMSDIASLWLHLDYRTVHDAKLIGDRVFGRAAYRGEIVWVPGNGGRRRRGPSVTHQTILIFARGREMIWNDDDPELRERFAETSLRMHFQNVDAKGRRYRERKINGKSYRYYADDGRRLGSVWTDLPAMRANTPLIRETTGYPTQKPEALLERIVRAASRRESRVLDPMCGSGTTLVAAERLGRRWAGIDQSPVAVRVATQRLALLDALDEKRRRGITG
jgi:site-specific DNA-methyltransferase (adenine-specific)